MNKKLIYLYFVGIILLSSCSRAPLPPPLPPATPVSPRADAIHTVGPGETFWRIAKMYDVPLAEIMTANNIANPQDLKMGQRLTIPHAAKLKPVVTLYPSHKWEYIIIDHSATDEGSSLSFHHAHLKKGWDKGVGYHFVIDNATNEKQDGEIEATPRWIKQLDGAHCKASDMNVHAIGICLVGNFDNERLSRKQMDSLVYLVNLLSKNYKIPIRNIIRHGHVPGAATDCPGTNFPWKEFLEKLDK